VNTLAALGGIVAGGVILFFIVAVHDKVKEWWDRGNASDADDDAA
jgi:hypothetical protein